MYKMNIAIPVSLFMRQPHAPIVVVTISNMANSNTMEQNIPSLFTGYAFPPELMLYSNHGNGNLQTITRVYKYLQNWNYTHTTILLPFFQVNQWQKKTSGLYRSSHSHHPNGRHSRSATPSRLISDLPPSSPPFLRRMPFLPQPYRFILAVHGQAANAGLHTQWRGLNICKYTWNDLPGWL